MNTKTVNTNRPVRTNQNTKTPRKTTAKYTALELEAVRLGREIKKALEAAKSDFV